MASIRSGLGFGGGMDEARGHSGELVLPVVFPSEAGAVALDMVGSELW